MVTYPSLHPSDASFVDIRSRNSLYVDKTHHFRNLLEPEGEGLLAQTDLAVRHQLLLRPRRFGKTLLINTLEAWFQGLPPDKASRALPHDNTLPDCPEGWSSPSWLWDGLDAADWHGVHGWHPVIRLDMSRVSPENPGRMQDALRKYLWGVVVEWGDASGLWQTDPFTPVPDLDPPQILDDLVTRLTNAYGERPVILVDEYDAPVTRHIASDMDMDMAPVLRPLRDLYRVLKDDAGRLYCVFVTGITRLARQHLFSAANNFVDISAAETHATICGFTEEEVGTCLAPHRDALRDLEPAFDDDRILADWRDMYNGYRFARHPDTELVCNPFTLTNGLHDTLTNETDRWKALQGKWPSAWSKTGHPEVAIRLAGRPHRSLPPGAREVDGQPAPLEGALDSLQRPDFARLMQDTGYYTWHGGHEPYLDFPNHEVAESWLRDILDLLGKSGWPESMERVRRMGDCLQACDMDGFADLLLPFYSEIPYYNLDSESCFRAVLQTVCRLISDEVRAEKPSWGGRSDLEIAVGDFIYAMEVKYRRDGRIEDSADKALKQIRDRPYGREHILGERNVVAVGLAFHKDAAAGTQLAYLTRDLSKLLRERDADADTPREQRRKPPCM